MNVIRRVFTISLLLGGLTAAARPDGGTAELYGTLERGGFRPGFSSSSLWRAGVRAEGVKTSGNTCYTGSFSYEEMHGKDMLTSMFVHPGYYPVDVLEFTPGDKTLQTYRVAGGLEHRFGGRWTAGASVDFTGENYAKRKDLRHTNYALDLGVLPSVRYRGDAVEAGLTVILRKTSESIVAEEFGAATGDTYYAFLDKGLRYGTWQAWDGAGIHLDEAGINRLPVKELSFGASVPLLFRPAGLSLEAGYVRTRGLVGEKGYDWFRFPGHKVTASARWTHSLPGGKTGTLTARYALRKQRLDETVLDKVTSGGITTPTLYGANTVSKRALREAVLGWDVRLDGSRFQTFRLGLGWNELQEASFLTYPYTDEGRLDAWRLSLMGTWQFGRFRLDLTGRAGMGTAREKGLSATAETASVKAPFRLQADWDRKSEYFTAPRAGADLSLRYGFASVKGLYLQWDGSWLHGFGIDFLPGTERFCTSFRAGYSF